MTVKVGFVKHPFKSVGKASNNITGAIGQGINDIFVSPIQDLSGTASNFINSPIWYIVGGGIVIVTVSSILQAGNTTNKALENPESLRIIAQAAAQAR